MLIRRQAELEEQAEKAATEVRAARQEAAGYLKITSTEIANWAGTIEARTHLPVLVRRLVHADVDPAAKVDFPGYDAGERKGWDGSTQVDSPGHWVPDRKAGWELSVSRSEEHTSELQSLMRISYAVFCLKKKNTDRTNKDKTAT